MLTIDNLIRRRQVLVNWCCMCRSDAESIPHLLLHCRVAYHLWTVALALFGMVWVQPGSVVDVLWSWKGESVGSERKKVWSWNPTNATYPPPHLNPAHKASLKAPGNNTTLLILQLLMQLHISKNRTPRSNPLHIIGHRCLLVRC